MQVLPPIIVIGPKNYLANMSDQTNGHKALDLYEVSQRSDF